MKMRKQLTYANVVATIAVVGVVGGGSAYAVSTIGTKDIRNGAVTGKKIKRSAVTAQKLRRGAVTEPKLAAGAVSADRLAPGAVGASQLAVAAVAGDKLAAGAVSADKLAGLTVRSASTEPFAGQDAHNGALRSKSVTVLCETGEVALGGGTEWSRHSPGEDSRHFTTELVPIVEGGLPVGYSARGASDEDPAVIGSYVFTAKVICLKG